MRVNLVTGAASGIGAVEPGYWKTVAAITPPGRIALPDEIAGTVAFLLGPDAGYITGQTMRVDGGLTL